MIVWWMRCDGCRITSAPLRIADGEPFEEAPLGTTPPTLRADDGSELVILDEVRDERCRRFRLPEVQTVGVASGCLVHECTGGDAHAFEDQAFRLRSQEEALMRPLDHRFGFVREEEGDAEGIHHELPADDAGRDITFLVLGEHEFADPAVVAPESVPPELAALDGRRGDVVLGGPCLVAGRAESVVAESCVMDRAVILVLLEPGTLHRLSADGVDTPAGDDCRDVVRMAFVAVQIDPDHVSRFCAEEVARDPPFRIAAQPVGRALRVIADRVQGHRGVRGEPLRDLHSVLVIPGSPCGWHIQRKAETVV